MDWCLSRELTFVLKRRTSTLRLSSFTQLSLPFRGNFSPHGSLLTLNANKNSNENNNQKRLYSKESESIDWSQTEAGVQIPALPLSGSVMVSKLFSLPIPQLPPLKNADKIGPLHQACVVN